MSPGSLRRFCAALALVTAVVACEPPAAMAIEGSGSGESIEFDLATGVYAVRWVAQEPVATGHGCHFGLMLDGTRVVDAEFGERIDPSTHVNLVYQGVGAGTTQTGSTNAMKLWAGTYRFRSSGNCAWEAQIVPGDPRALPTRDGIEQARARDHGLTRRP